MPENDAKSLISRLRLAPHPEGGWYRETWRAPSARGMRSGGTLIYFLLEQGHRSHWHRVDATEIWLWHSGAPLSLSLAAADTGPVTSFALGPDMAAGQQLQLVIDPAAWQAAEAAAGWTLVSCVVVPGFEFSGFQLAPADWTPGSPQG